MEWKKVSVCLVVVALMAGSGAWAAHHEGDFEKMIANWTAAYNEGDVATIAALYTEDGMRMPPDLPIIKGRDAIQAQIQEGMDQGLAKVKIDLVDVQVAGDKAMLRGIFEGIDAEGNSLGTGKWTNVCNKVDGKWLIQYDIYNFDAPRPAAE